MKEAEIRKYASLMKELELTALEISDDGHRLVRLERAVGAAAPVVPVVAAAVAPAAVAEAAPKAEASGDYYSVTSPIVGVFYAAPAENAEPYVSLGDRVEKGSVLCVVEAMKLMNEICAEQGGVIEEICVTNGQVVEFGTELFRIRR